MYSRMRGSKRYSNISSLPKLCPLCNKKLEEKQINLEEAVLLCTNLTCPYPVDYECVLINTRLHKLESSNNNNSAPLFESTSNKSNIVKTSPSSNNFGDPVLETNLVENCVAETKCSFSSLSAQVIPHSLNNLFDMPVLNDGLVQVEKQDTILEKTSSNLDMSRALDSISENTADLNIQSYEILPLENNMIDVSILDNSLKNTHDQSILNEKSDFPVNINLPDFDTDAEMERIMEELNNFASDSIQNKNEDNVLKSEKKISVVEQIIMEFDDDYDEDEDYE